MKKVILSGSTKLQEKINDWVYYFKNKGYEIIDYPKLINQKNYMDELPVVYKDFYKNIEACDIFFLMNEDKNGIVGYIGSAGFSELVYAIMQNILHNKNIEIYILKEPAKSLNCYDEINLWLKLGWIKLYK